MPAIPSTTIEFPATRVLPRQETVTVTSESDDSDSLGGGAIAGIVVGSIVGFFLLIWVIWSCMRLGAPPSRGGMGEADYSPERHGSYSPHQHHHHRRHHRRHPRREVREYRTTTPVVVNNGRRRSVSVSSPHRAHTRSRSRSRGRAVY